ncbi:MAG: hypothetical protein ACHQC8_00615 [Solirubrobacterales bacterium]
MSILGEAIGRGRRGAATAPAPPPVAPPVAPPAPESDGRSELRRRYDALAEQVTEMHWDLGGLAYEMAIRDHFRLDVLVRRAAALQERDAELAEVERLLRMEDSASAGSCPHCAAPHSRGALFCWQCGATLMERSQSTVARPPETAIDDDGGSTAVMDALLAPKGAGASEGNPFAAE